MVRQLLSFSAALVYGLASWPAGAQAAVSMVDDTQHRVELAGPARRIVTLAPHLTELVYEAGAGERLVGVAAHSDYPPSARELPRVGDAHGLDLERIVMLQPDLVVAWGSGSPSRQIARLRQLGYAVFTNEPRTLDDIATTLERLGTLAGTEDAARIRAREFRRQLSVLQQRHRDRAVVRVFYQIWDHPLLSVSTDHVITDALGQCRAENVLHRMPVRVPRLGREAVLLADPDAIVVAAEGRAAESYLAQWRRWSGLRAVRAGHVFALDSRLLHRHTPRILEGVWILCGQIDAVRTMQ